MKVKRFTGGNSLVSSDSVYLGIDPSLTGFAMCLMNSSGDYVIEVVSSELRGAARLQEIKLRLQKFVELHNLADVAMEGMSFGSKSSSVSSLAELAGVVKEFMFSELNITPMLIPPMSLKKYVCGTGKGVTKSQIMMSTLKKWGVELPDDNAADAYGITSIVMGLADTAYESEVVLKMQDPKYR